MFSTILKNMSSSVGMMEIPIYGKSSKWSTPPISIFMYVYIYIHSGKRLHNYGKTPFLMQKLAISMVFFKHPQTSHLFHIPSRIARFRTTINFTGTNRCQRENSAATFEAWGTHQSQKLGENLRNKYGTTTTWNCLGKNLGEKYGETIWVSEIGDFDVISAYQTYDFIQGQD